MKFIYSFFVLFILLCCVATATIIDDSVFSSNCQINKTGAETNLDVWCEEVSENVTIIHVVANSTYYDELVRLGKDITKVPVNFIDPITHVVLKPNEVHKSLILDKSDFNLYVPGYDNKMYVTHEPNLMYSIKIGWESVVVDVNIIALATAYSNIDNICIKEDKCHIAYIDNVDDLAYSYAYYNPITHKCEGSWTKVSVDAGTFEQAGMFCPSKLNTLFITAITTGNKVMYNTTNAGVTWTDPIILEDDSPSTIYGSSDVIDSNDIIHSILVLTYDTYYVNSSVPDASILLSTTIDGPGVDIDVDLDNNIFIAVANSGTDNVSMSSSINGLNFYCNVATGWGDLTTTDGEGIDMRIDKYENIHLAFTAADDLIYCKSNITNYCGGISAWSCLELDANPSFNPDIAVSDMGLPYILYHNLSVSDDGHTVIAYNNGTGWVVNRESPTGDAGTNGFPSISDSNFPVSNRLRSGIMNTLRIFNADLYYDNISIYYVDPIVTMINGTTATPLVTANQSNKTIYFSINQGDYKIDSDLNITSVTIGNSSSTILTNLVSINNITARVNDNASTNLSNPTEINFSNFADTDYSIILTSNKSTSGIIFSEQYSNKSIRGFQIKTYSDANTLIPTKEIDWVAIQNDFYDIDRDSTLDMQCHSVDYISSTATHSFPISFNSTNFSVFATTILDDDATLIMITGRTTTGFTIRAEDDAGATEIFSKMDYCAIRRGEYNISSKYIKSGNTVYSRNLTVVFTTPMPSVDYSVILSSDFTSSKGNKCLITAKRVNNFSVYCTADDSSETDNGANVDWLAISDMGDNVLWYNTYAQQLSYNGSVWGLNITTPSLEGALYDLTINVTYIDEPIGKIEPLSVLYPFVDSVTPTISSLTNLSTTNQSSLISWTCSENCNYSISWTGGAIFNNTFKTSHSPTLTGLLNSTTYTVNLTVWDSSGNNASNNTFSFTTAANVPPAADTCTYPGSGDWEVDCSDNCLISVNTELPDNILRLTGSGTFTVNANITCDRVEKVLQTCRLINQIGDNKKLIIKLG